MLRFKSLLRVPRSPFALRFLTTCPSCSQPLPTALPACNSCGSISPISPSLSFYDIFDLPSRPNPFLVDQALLKRRFREAQAACHPDSWASKGQHKQDIAQSLSSRLNEAYNSLLHPLRRAEYILEQNGLPIAEADQLDDMEFIAEIMEARESIDDAETPDELSRIVADNAAKIEATVEELERTVGWQEWVAVKEAAFRLRYLEGIGAAGRQKEEELVQ
ncbi:Co-chaperone Hsc20 [Mycena crocata]|nr:Co-chaperone Hsc20 [Mycena crocata]